MENRIYVNMYKRFFVHNIDLNCSYCDKPLNNNDKVIIIEKYDKKKMPIIDFSCICCINKIKFTHEQEHRRIANVMNNILSDLIHYIPQPVELKGSKNYNAFSAVDLDSDRTIDKTKHAGRESFEGAKIGDCSYEKLEYERIDVRDVKSYAQSLQVEQSKAQKLIE